GEPRPAADRARAQLDRANLRRGIRLAEGLRRDRGVEPGMGPAAAREAAGPGEEGGLPGLGNPARGGRPRANHPLCQVEARGRRHHGDPWALRAPGTVAGQRGRACRLGRDLPGSHRQREGKEMKSLTTIVASLTLVALFLAPAIAQKSTASPSPGPEDEQMARMMKMMGEMEKQMGQMQEQTKGMQGMGAMH